jgi:hypothetical protein
MKKITTTYGEFHKTFSENTGEKFFVKTHRGSLVEINATIEKPATMLKIAFSDGTVLECASGHAFMGVDGCASVASDLVINSRILTTHGTIIVKSIKKSNETVAYDIAIDAPHYYVNDESSGIIHHNTSYALLMASAYLKKHKDAVLIYYDSEFGAGEGAMSAFGIDSDRVLHIPIMNIEELKFDIMQKLDNNNDDGIKRGDKVFILVDSIGNLASVRESNNAIEQNSAQDMTRAKELKSAWRLITPHLLSKNIPMIAIQHVYEEMKMFGKTIMSGGSGGLLSSDTVWIVGKSQEKEGTEIVGYNFTINVEKSRYVKEKSKIPILVKFDGGISKYTGILAMAIKNARYQLVDKSTGELLGDPVKESATECEEFLGVVLKRESFKQWVRDTYKIMNAKILADSEDDE